MELWRHLLSTVVVEHTSYSWSCHWYSSLGVEQKTEVVSFISHSCHSHYYHYLSLHTHSLGLHRQESEHLYHFKALILSTLLQLPIFLTELLVAINLDTRAHQWRAIFTLLYALPLIYTFPCIWSCFRKRMLDVSHTLTSLYCII